jgi:hypothetical protein
MTQEAYASSKTGKEGSKRLANALNSSTAVRDGLGEKNKRTELPNNGARLN